MTDTQTADKPQSKLKETWKGATVDKKVALMADNPPPAKKASAATHQQTHQSTASAES